jgi:hypothetical protein
MTRTPFALPAVTSSPRKSRSVAQLPGIFEGHGRAYPSLLWNVASTMYDAPSLRASSTQ